MKRHEFAPNVVPHDARRFLELPENSVHLPSFRSFYRDYCYNSPDHPIIREIDGKSYNFSDVISTKMTRSNKGRCALVLRATDDKYHKRRYRLFTRPFGSDGEVTEYDITETQYSYGDHRIMPHASYTHLFLATATDGMQGVLEIGSENHQSAVWVFDGEEYVLENIPRLPEAV
ncbi:MAG TPA: hypothetical protein VMT96_00475 [Candidatus Bathyarchaeia archaeon]|nr:hypothetical protein [Candidatus Bathyarchaeia archaeon]